MKKILTFVCLASISALFVALSTGCMTVASGNAVGGTAYVMGDLETGMNVTPAKLRKAIPEAGKSLKLNVISEAGDELTGKYVFSNAAEKKITVSYTATATDLMTVKIRVGTFGDEVLSYRVLKAIESNL